MTEVAEPIPMLLWCPLCHARHVDEPDSPNHKTHACQKCGLLWRPCLLPTVGVEFLPGCLNNSYSTIPGTPDGSPQTGEQYDDNI